MIFVIGVISRGDSPESRTHLPSRFHLPLLAFPSHRIHPTVLLGASCVSADPDEV